MKRFLVQARSPFFAAIIAPGLLGSLLGWRQGNTFSWPLFALTLLGLIAAHAGGNLLNDYFDTRAGADRINKHRTPFSGGSPSLANGEDKPSTFLLRGLASLIVALACAVVLAAMVDNGFGPVLLLSAIGFLCALFYTAPPLKLAYRGFGEMVILLSFGILPVLGAYYVQAKALSWLAVLASLPTALLIVNIIWINQFPDHDSDSAAGKRHLVVRLGLSRSRFVYYGLALGAFGSVLILSATPPIGLWALLGLGGFPAALAAALRLHVNYGRPEKLVTSQALTIAAHSITGMLLCLAVALEKITNP